MRPVRRPENGPTRGSPREGPPGRPAGKARREGPPGRPAGKARNGKARNGKARNVRVQAVCRTRAGRMLEELGRRSAPADGWPGHLPSRAVAAAFPPRPDRINTGGPHQRGRSPGHSAGAVFGFHDGAHLLEIMMGDIMMGDIMMGFHATSPKVRGGYGACRSDKPIQFGKFSDTPYPSSYINPPVAAASISRLLAAIAQEDPGPGPRPPPRGPDGVTTRGLRFSPTPRRSPPVQPIPPTRPDASGVG